MTLALTRMVLAAMFLTVSMVRALAATPVQTRAEDQAVQQTIEAGRLNAMMDQVAVLLGIPNGDGAASNAHEDAFSELSGAVRSYNRLVVVACDQEIFAHGTCPETYGPDWLSRPPQTASDLQLDIDDATQRIEPFWSAVCAARDAEHKVCQLE